MVKLFFVLPVVLIEIIFACLEIITTTISGLLAIVRVWFMRDYDYLRWLKRDLADCDAILELGCGPPLGFIQTISPLLQVGYGKKTDAVDIYKPYIDKHNELGSFCNCWVGDVLNIVLPEKTYDAVVMFDVLEHLPREKVESSDLLSRIEKCAIKKVIFFTPNGHVPNDEIDGNPYQAHLSGWEPGDYLARGYKVVGATGLRWLFGKASLPKYRPHSISLIIGMLSQPVVYYKAKWGWHSYAVKEVTQ